VAALDEGLRWVEVRLAELVDGAPPDAVQIRRKDGPRSWPVHALIKHEGHASDTEQRVRAELAALVEEATEVGSALHVRLVTLRGGVVAASRAVYLPAPERSADEGVDDDAQRGAGSALVATNRDLRALLEVYARQQGNTVSAAMQGWAGSMARTSELEREVAELRAALVVAEQAQQGDPVVQQALSALAPQLPLLLAQFSQARSGAQ
jgi:hypothetical protein